MHIRQGALFCLLLFSMISYGQDTAPKYSNEFLSIGVGARALGMSSAQVAIADDVTAGYWNPAGLMAIDSKHEFSLMHSEYFAGIAKYDYAAYSTSVDSVSRLGISLIRFAVDDIPDTRFLYDANGALNYDNIRFFSAADYAFILSYARKTPLLNGLNVGANFKVVHRSVGEFANAWGFGLDAGLQLNSGAWKYGLMLRDITGTFNAWSFNNELLIDVFTQTGNEVPTNSIEVTLPRMILGLSRSFRNSSNSFGVMMAADLVTTFDGKRNVLVKTGAFSIDPRIGVEIDYKQMAFIRLGIGEFQQIKDFDGSTSGVYQPNFGVGFVVNKISIDYALTDVADQTDALYSNIFSIKVSLD